jgi:IS5 family transposase
MVTSKNQRRNGILEARKTKEGAPMNQISLYDESKALERLSRQGDKLEWLNKVMDWRMFQPILNKAKPNRTSEEKGGRPPIPPMMMFKIVILQELYGVSNDDTEYQINDRLSWKRFLGLTMSDKSPDSTRIWLFREALTANKVYDDLFVLFNEKMEELGVITHKGSIVDASFVDVPRQRNTREENKTIKEGEIPEAWQAEDQTHMLSQKDTDARWAKKNNEVHYGYKDHVLCDAHSKMIVDFVVTSANVHDSQTLHTLADGYINELWADSAYLSEESMTWFAHNYPNIKLHFNEKGYKNHPLTDDQKAGNREKSRIRSRIEHIFGHMSGSMGGMFIRCIGITRGECAIGLKNLAYNISRYATMCRLEMAPCMA